MAGVDMGMGRGFIRCGFGAADCRFDAVFHAPTAGPTKPREVTNATTPENPAISPLDMDSTTPSLSLGVKAKPRAWYCTADNAPSLLSKVAGVKGRTMLKRRSFAVRRVVTISLSTAF